MQEVIIATLVVGVVGLLIGLALVIAGKKFAVETDEREGLVREHLPGNNCGACGFAGCDAVAAAIVKGEAPVSACPANNAENVKKISEIMGVDNVETIQRVAFVRCAGSCDNTKEKCNYVGIADCRAASMAGLNMWQCDYGCLGYGSCVKACAFDAIHVENGVAVVDRDKCSGCGQCTRACPKGLIELVPVHKEVAVRCSNHDRGIAVKNVCGAGCLGCSLCTRQCENGAITVEGNLAHVDYDKCIGCGKCADKCPRQIITRL